MKPRRTLPFRGELVYSRRIIPSKGKGRSQQPKCMRDDTYYKKKKETWEHGTLPPRNGGEAGRKMQREKEK
jgi:hypothetical protein